MLSYFYACVFQEYEKLGNYFLKHLPSDPEKWRSFCMKACVQNFVVCVHTKNHVRNIFRDTAFIFLPALLIFLMGGHKFMRACA